jgi:hypothetical protein
MWLGTLPFMGASFAAIRLQRLIDPYVKRLGKGASHAVVSIEHFTIHTEYRGPSVGVGMVPQPTLRPSDSSLGAFQSRCSRRTSSHLFGHPLQIEAVRISPC